MIPTIEQIKRASSGGYARFIASHEAGVDVHGPFGREYTLDATIIDTTKGIVQWRNADNGRVVKPRDDWEFKRADGRPLDDEKADKADNATIATVGPYVIDLTVGGDLKSRYVVRHVDGGLVPLTDGRFGTQAMFNTDVSAREHAQMCFSALLSGQPSPFPRRRAA